MFDTLFGPWHPLAFQRTPKCVHQNGIKRYVYSFVSVKHPCRLEKICWSIDNPVEKWYVLVLVVATTLARLADAIIEFICGYAHCKVDELSICFDGWVLESGQIQCIDDVVWAVASYSFSQKSWHAWTTYSMSWGSPQTLRASSCSSQRFSLWTFWAPLLRPLGNSRL